MRTFIRISESGDLYAAVEVEPANTVGFLKYRFCEETQEPLCEVSLSYGDYELDDDDTLADHNIGAETSVYFTRRWYEPYCPGCSHCGNNFCSACGLYPLLTGTMHPDYRCYCPACGYGLVGGPPASDRPSGEAAPEHGLESHHVPAPDDSTEVASSEPTEAGWAASLAAALLPFQSRANPHIAVSSHAHADMHAQSVSRSAMNTALAASEAQSRDTPSFQQLAAQLAELGVAGRTIQTTFVALLDKLNRIEEELHQAGQANRCCICLDSPHDAQLLPCMHNTFCKACLERHLQADKTCPVCRAAVRGMLTTFH